MAVRFFRYFPDVTYAGYTAKDITKVSVLQDTLNDETFTYFPYTVREEETAQDVAYFYYGDVSFVWLVYMSNKMKDPYYDWPMGQRQLEDYMQDQYLYACAVCTLKRTPDTLELVSDILDETAAMMLAIARGRTTAEFDYLDPTKDTYNADYLDIWNWLKANSNAGLSSSIADEYAIENYIAIQETLQEILDSDFNPSYNSSRNALYDLFFTLGEDGMYYDLNGDGTLDAQDIADVKSYALGQYENISSLNLIRFQRNIQHIIDAWKLQPTGYYEQEGETNLFRLGRPMSYTYAYDYLLESMPEGLADIIVRIPIRSDLKNTLNVLEWAQDTTITRNIVHYQNVDDPEHKISADTYALNLVGSSQSWTDFDPDEWNPVRVYDYEFLANEEKRSIQLIGRDYARDIESLLEGIMK